MKFANHCCREIHAALNFQPWNRYNSAADC